MPEMPHRPRLLFVYLQSTSFVRDDLGILSEAYDVRLFRFDSTRYASRVGRAWSLLFFAVKQVAWLLRELPRADLVYGWFADYHLVLPTLLAKRYEKPVAVCLGGFDAIEVPDLDYGVYGSPWRALLARFVIRHASLLLPVNETLIQHSNVYSAFPERLENGIAYHVPGFRTPYVTLPTGYDPEQWSPGPAERAPVVCSVGLLRDDVTFRRKGIDLLIEAARRLPDITFQVVGVPPERLAPIRDRYRPPENVAFLPPRPREELVSIYGQAAVYAQLSRAEGMPNVLCEAMLCGCVPVGSAAFGIPDAMGDVGYVVERPEPELIAACIRKALQADAEVRQQARRQIVRHFHRERRRRMLLETLGSFERRPAAAASHREERTQA